MKSKLTGLGNPSAIKNYLLNNKFQIIFIVLCDKNDNTTKIIPHTQRKMKSNSLSINSLLYRQAHRSMLSLPVLFSQQCIEN